ncbi:MAG: hypothetical protein V1918_09325 [Planctomycetota bacterium]
MLKNPLLASEGIATLLFRRRLPSGTSAPGADRTGWRICPKFGKKKGKAMKAKTWVLDVRAALGLSLALTLALVLALSGFGGDERLFAGKKVAPAGGDVTPAGRDVAPAGGEKPLPEEAPPLAGEKLFFNSDVAFEVYAGNEERPGCIGRTPAVKPLEIPACRYWVVLPLDPVDMEQVAAEVRARGIPGLGLPFSSQDADLAHLEGLKSLRTLYLLECPHITSAGVNKLEKALPNINITWDHPLWG